MLTETLEPRDRIIISSKRLFSLRSGRGEYTPSERAEEIERTCDPLHQAHADQRKAWISAVKI